MQANAHSCPHCNSQRIEASSVRASDLDDPHARITLQHCLACEFAWQFPQARSATQSAAYFQDSYARHQTGGYFDPQRRDAVAEVQCELLRLIAPQPARLLDIGAGDGNFIRHAAQLGWQCTGVDPAAVPQDFAVNGTGSARLLAASTQQLQQLQPAQRFDVVSAFDVIEHVDHPHALIGDAAALVQDEGVFLLETGNFQSADRIEGDSRWWCYQADHRWYFAPPQLASLLKQAGFAHVALWLRAPRPGATLGARYAGPSHKQLAGELLRAPQTATRTVKRFGELKKAARRWTQWAALPIFCLVARKAGQLPQHAALLPL